MNGKDVNCKNLDQKLIPYLDGKLSPASRRDMEKHLSACADCRRRATEFRMVWDVLDDLPPVAPSPEFDALVRARVADEPRRSQFWNWFVPVPRLALAATALVVFSIWLSSFRPSRQPVRVTAQGSETEFGMIKDLRVLEDYDVLADFDALSEMPVQHAAPAAQPAHQM